MPSLSSSPWILGAPQRVLNTHSSDLIAHLFADPWSATARTGFPSPTRGEAHSMPTHYSLGPDDGYGVKNTRTATIELNEQGAVGGHVHEYEELAWDPWIVFPGNLQGRSIRECGPKGAVLVDVTDGRVAAVRRLIVDQARWAVVAVDLDGISEGSEALQKIEDEIRPATEQAEGRLVAVRVHLTRAAALNHAIKADPRSFSDEVQAAADRCGEDVWVEGLRIEAAETPVFTSSSNAVGSLDLDAAVTPLFSDPALRKNAADLIAEITAKLPRGLHTNDPPLPDDLDGLLNDARSLVLGRVSPER
jgi:DNA repair protein SbcD/Mre11